MIYYKPPNFHLEIEKDSIVLKRRFEITSNLFYQNMLVIWRRL